MIYTIDQSETSSGCNNFLKKYKSFSRRTRYFGGIRPVGKILTIQTAYLLDRKRSVKKHRMSIRWKN
ncbi:hypothetical protein CLOSTASPAR_02848 [[Clostridium] asparagiforme DSM 15981]|uniref:Uncharacterized protein n=1 Tax=[Clostridium] asparagiforme DSM 15981 TaxID=518636 RepID=C0D0R1_9FIRM|nr:hypothetical protein CLOSTASPAR_02848 [[Clostridium] asparagiforme DSM 15981]